MREGPAIAIRREDYAPTAFRIRSVELTFDLDPAKTIVASRMVVERAPDTPVDRPLRLHGEALTLLRVLADGESVSFRHDAGDLVIDAPPPAPTFTLEIRNAIAPEKNSELSGLYTSGGGFFTQCEAEGFRRITYFLDRPDVMAVYTVTLRADKAKYPVLLSNGNLVETAELDGGRHLAKWHDPFPKPSYLFALVAADLVCREQTIRSRTGREHLLQIWVRRGDLDKTGHALASLVAAVAWDEARFGLGLDLDRFMVVAVGDFNFGAMENKGLNLFNAKCVLASAATATDEDFAAVESTIGHEYFHNWTGNRVTCRDWFQLSLKEGLTVYRDQEFSADMSGGGEASRAVQRIAAVRRLRALQFPEDAGPMAHPVRPERYVEIDNFYTPTVYEKGAEVVRMMATLVGRDGFRRGMDLYFARHDGQAVTCDDFARAIADANPDSALSTQLDVFQRWYAQAGTPRLVARGVHDPAARTYTLTLTQQPALASGQAQLLPVAMGLVGPDGAALPLKLEGETEAGGQRRVLVLGEQSRRWTFVDIEAPPVPSLLQGFSAPVLLDDGLDDSQRLHLLRHDADAFNRWEAAQNLALARLLAALPPDAAPLALDAPYLDALRALIDEPALDPAFKALALTPPSEQLVAERCAEVDPQRIHAIHLQYRRALAAALNGHWLRAWDANAVREGYRPDHAQAGRRALALLALRNLVLHAVASGDPVWPGRAYQRVKDAGTMTDRHGALVALIDAGSTLAEAALAHFQAQAAGDPLVLDKWFAVQALASEPEDTPGSVLARVRSLTQHAGYSARNPNRARALLVNFCHFNPAAFHRADASGYAFWAERVLELDAINPQLAARLARALDRWRRLAEPWRSGAREAVQRLAAHADLSNDVREIVSRALED